MPIRFACPKCKKQLTLDSKLAGKTGKCSCGATLKIPAAKSQAQRLAQAKKPAAAASTDAMAEASAFGSMFDDLTESDFNRESPYQNVYSPPKASGGGGKLLRQLSKEDGELGLAGKERQGQLNGTLIFMAVMNLLAACFCLAVGGLVFLGVAVAATMESAVNVPAFNIDIALIASILVGFGLFELASGLGIFFKQKWGHFIATMSQAFGVVFMGGVLVVTLMDTFDTIRFFVIFALLFGAISSCAFMFKDGTKLVFGLQESKLPMIAGIFGMVIGLALWGSLFAAVAMTRADPAAAEEVEEIGEEYDGGYEGDAEG